MASPSRQQPFVGRQAEFKKFQAMLDSPDGPWLMWVTGPAGQGKSRFLEVCLVECERRRLKHSGILDFLDLKLQTPHGLIAALADRFGLSEHPAIRQAASQYQDEVSRGEFADPDVLRHGLAELEQAFMDELRPKRRRQKHKVIIADTVESIAPRDLSNWFFGQFLPQLQPHFRVVAAGREVPEHCVEASQAVRITLAGLREAEIESYFRAVGVALDNQSVKHIYRISQGQPLFIALLEDALANGSLSLQELAKLPSEGVTSRLFVSLFRLETIENLVLLHMAHAYHNFDADLLSAMYTPENYSATELADVLHHLERFSFVRYTSERRVWALHDYVREWINRTVWRELDLSCQVRSEISKKVVDYYAPRIDGQATPYPTPETDSLRVEYLYHLLFSDRERAYRELWGLLDRSWHSFKYDYMDVLLDMTHQVNGVLESIGKFDLVLDQIEKTAYVWLHLEVWKTTKALSLADEVLTSPTPARYLFLRALVAKATALARLGDIDKSIQILWEAFTGFEVLLDLLTTAELGDDTAKAKLALEHGIATEQGIRPERYLVLNTIGVLERRRARFEEAEKAFVKSFELSKSEGNTTWQASASTQLGTILGYKGEMAVAYDYIHLGLSLRRQLGQRGREAFSLQALGMLQQEDNRLRDARDSFQAALEIWRGLRAEGDIASVLRNLGWTDYLDGKYESAESYLNEANEIYMRLSLERELPNLRHKQGALWIAKARVVSDAINRAEHLKRAESYLLEGLELSRKFNEPLYTVLCLTDLCCIADMRGEYEHILGWEAQVRAYEAQGYHFEQTYADLEQVLGDVALHQASIGQPNFEPEQFDKAIDHYCKMFLYLVQHNPNLYRRRREFLREWLPSLPGSLRQRAARRLIDCWNAHLEISAQYPGLIRTAKLLGGVE